MNPIQRVLAPLTVVVFACWMLGTGAIPAARAMETSPISAPAPVDEWSWPVEGPRTVVEPFRAPAHAYGAGHRGIDLTASPAHDVRAPADGVVAFAGTVVDRPLLTIEHPGGYVSTFEPLVSPLRPGDAVSRGDVVGTPAAGGHAPSGTLHLGVRLDGIYIDPMLLFGAAERAILLPCCGAPR